MEIMIALLGTITTILTIILTNYFSKRNELKFSERKLKESYYLEYIKSISNSANYNNKLSVFDENKAFNNLILIANNEVLKKLYVFQDLRIKHIKDPINNYTVEYERLFTILVKAIRKDLYGKKEKDIPNIYVLGGMVPPSQNHKKM